MRHKLLIVLVTIALLTTGLAANVAYAQPPSSTIVKVTANDLETETDRFIAAEISDKWFFYNDETDEIDNSLGSFVTGPGTPPVGEGSIEISVNGTQRRNIATYQFRGTPLEDITALGFSTYNPSAGNGTGANSSGFLHFNVDFDESDTWQRRLVYVPSKNGTVLPDTWQHWDAIDGGNALWQMSGGDWPGTTTPGTTARTWADILDSYPGVRIRVTDAFLGIRVGEPYQNGYTENIDAFVFGTADGVTTYDFDLPTSGETIDDLQEATAELVENRNAERKLLASLNRAERLMEVRPAFARMALLQYILQVRLFDAFGLIDDDAADQLIEQAQDLMASLN